MFKTYVPILRNLNINHKLWNVIVWSAKRKMRKCGNEKVLLINNEQS